MGDNFDETMLLMGFTITRKASTTHYKYAGPPTIFVSVLDSGVLTTLTPRCYVDMQGSINKDLAPMVQLITDKKRVLEVIAQRLKDERK